MNPLVNFVFPKKLVKMLAVGQSRLARRADMHHIRGMPGYLVH